MVVVVEAEHFIWVLWCGGFEAETGRHDGRI